MLLPKIRKGINYFIIIFPFAVLLGWFYLKVFQFQFLNENFGDGLIALQLSRGWLEGRPLLFDTYYGYHWLHHNYYFILLTGFVTKFTGIYGLFIVYLGLLGLFLGKWIRSYHKNDWLNEWFIIVLFAVGPIAYHVFLDIFGWHPEQYFLPLMGLFALSMAKRQWFWAVLWGGLTLSVKETSIVLICGLLLFASVVSNVFEKPNQAWHCYFLNRKNLLIVAVCLVIFVLGIGWLSYLNGPHPSRLGQAFALINKKATLTMALSYTFLVGIFASVSIIAGVILFVPWWRVVPHSRVIIGSFLGFCLILLMVFYVEGLLYFPEPNLSIRYPARVGSLWAFMMSCYVFLSIRSSEYGLKPHSNQREWLLWGGLFQFFISPMAVANATSIHGQMFSIKKNFLFIHDSRLGTKPYAQSPVQSLYELTYKLPAGSEVVCPSEYVSIFQNVYANEWSDDLRILKRPHLYIYDKKDLKTNKKYKFPKGGYKAIPHSQFLILADSVWYNQHYK